MRRKIILSIALVLLSASMLSLTFGEVNAIRQPAFDFNAKDLNKGLHKNEWSLNNAREWGDFAYVDKDSAEIVIGLTEADQDSCSELGRLTIANGGKVVSTVSKGELVSAIVVDMPFDLIPSFVDKAKATDLTKYVEPNMKFRADFVPNDPYWSLQWGPQKIEADAAWDTNTGDPRVLVAVVDTGIDWGHRDLDANYVALGYDWVNMDSDPMDDNGHGTHVAGTIAAELDNRKGIAGMAQVRIMAEKGLDSEGVGSEAALANAIYHAVNQSADIISNSWGGPDSALIHDAIRYAYGSGALIVASAGNSASSIKSYPAAYNEVVAVAATDKNDNPAWFSTYGDWIDLSAPGVDIYSTAPDNSYQNMSGTSMSAPHVSGTAALAWSQFPNITRDLLRAQLWLTADDLGASGFDIYHGYGRVNARKAVQQNPPEHDLVVLSPLEILETCLWQGKPVTLTTVALNGGTNNETNVEIQLLVNGTLVNSTSVAFLPSGASTTLGFSWIPPVAGNYNITSYAVPVVGETTENNAISKIVSVEAPILMGSTYRWLASDPNEGGWNPILDQFDLAGIAGKQDGEILYFRGTHYGRWITVSDILDLILLDSDQNPDTGLPDGTYLRQNTHIGADYVIVIGWDVNAMFRWDPNIDWWDEGDPIPLAYFHANDRSGTYFAGVYLSDLGAPEGVDGAVLDNMFGDWMPDVGCFRLRLPIHDIAATDVTSAKTIAGQGYTTGINFTVSNQGEFSETINVTIYAASYPIHTMNIALESGASTTVSFTWNTTGFAYGNYTISATVAPVQGETDTSDNTCTGNAVLVTIPGDVNGDRMVNSLDVGTINAHWYPGPPIGALGYSANADINSDGAVDILDAGIVNAHWGQSW